MRRAEQVVRADGEDDCVRLAHALADPLLFQARQHVSGLRSVDAEVDGLDAADAVRAELLFEASGDSLAGLIAGTVGKRIAEGDYMKCLGHGGFPFRWRGHGCALLGRALPAGLAARGREE